MKIYPILALEFQVIIDIKLSISLLSGHIPVTVPWWSSGMTLAWNVKRQSLITC